MVVRDATAADAPALAPLLGELGYPAAIDALESRMRRMLSREDQRILVAERDGAALGLLALHIFPVLAYDRDLAMIMALVVTERARGLGVGRALIERAEAVGQSLGASRLMVTTHVRRADAHAFYERLGFEFTGRRYIRGIP
ncbi:MAG TPA: GNAT family N-acetyltransferase [Gemmatimonadaceae bacterium]|nr:GNAT family N-acetyltransferase [Gemmatimonadaceae bacterium]